MNHEYVIIAENISKSYKIGKERIEEIFKNVVSVNQQLKVLDNVSFQIQKGSITGIIGENGSGKSTLLKIIGNVIKPDSGNIEIYGKIGSIIELGSGFHPDLSGYDNIYFNASLYGFSQNEVNAVFEDILQFSELGNFIYEPIKHFSSGMMMRLAFSIITHLPFDILLLDEVFTVGDQNFKNKCIRKIQDFAEKGKTILIVSHDFSILKMVCHEIIYFHQQKILKKGKVMDVIEEYVVHSQVNNENVQFINNQFEWKEATHTNFKEVIVRTEDGKYRYKNTESIRFEFSFVKVNTEKSYPIIVVKHGKDLSFLTTSILINQEASDTYLKDKGQYHLTMELPSNLLNDGMYFLDLYLINTEGKEELFIENVCMVHIDNEWKSQLNEISRNNFNGPIFLKANWKLSKT